MALNKILPFADTASVGNILTDTAYSTDAQRSIGHQPGIARQELANKQARQSSVIAAGVAQFLADNQTIDVVDTLTPAQIATMLFGVSSKIFNSDDILTTGRALTASDINKHLLFGGVADASFTLPPVNSLPSGSVIYVRGGQSIATFNVHSGNFINVNNGSTVTSCSCFGSESIMLVSNGSGDWRLTKINPRETTTPYPSGLRPLNTSFTNSSRFIKRVSIVVDLNSNGAFIRLSTPSYYRDFNGNSGSRGSLEIFVKPGEAYSTSTTGTVGLVAWWEHDLTV